MTRAMAGETKGGETNAAETNGGETKSLSHLDVVILRVVLLAVAIACVVEFWYANAHTDVYQLQSPLLTPRVWNLYLLFKLLSVVAVVGIWNWRAWGLQLLTAMGIAMLFTEFYAAGSFAPGVLLHASRIPLVLAVRRLFPSSPRTPAVIPAHVIPAQARRHSRARHSRAGGNPVPGDGPPRWTDGRDPRRRGVESETSNLKTRPVRQCPPGSLRRLSGGPGS
jgi:hypothetical protein